MGVFAFYTAEDSDQEIMVFMQPERPRPEWGTPEGSEYISDVTRLALDGQARSGDAYDKDDLWKVRGRGRQTKR